MDVRYKIASLGLVLPPPPKPVAAYVPAVRAGNLVFISGQLPFAEGKLIAVGRAPSAVSVEAAQGAARQCALNALAILDAELAGDWSRLSRIVRLGVFVASEPDFTDQPTVANGASELMAQLFGTYGRHARAAVGVTVLPLGATVELEMIAALRWGPGRRRPGSGPGPLLVAAAARRSD